MSASADDVVLSDVHLGSAPGAASDCTRYTFVSQATPTAAAASVAGSGACPVDADGDVVLPRRAPRGSQQQHHITVWHALATPISRCGEQVWQGALLLADYCLSHPQQLRGRVVLEFGAGVGVTSLAAARAGASAVFLTDASAGVLALACRNAAHEHGRARDAAGGCAQQQQQQQQQPVSADFGSIRVRQLDFLSLFDTPPLQHVSQPAAVLELLNTTVVQQPANSQQHDGGQQHGQAQQTQHHVWAWQPQDLQLLAQTSLWLAADVVYSQELTDAFLRTAAQLMRWQQRQQRQQPPGSAGATQPAAAPARLLVAIEKRYNFTLRDLDAVAPAFDHFLTYVQPVGADSGGGHTGAGGSSQQQQQQPLFLGRRIDVSSVPQVCVGGMAGGLQQHVQACRCADARLLWCAGCWCVSLAHRCLRTTATATRSSCGSLHCHQQPETRVAEPVVPVVARRCLHVAWCVVTAPRRRSLLTRRHHCNHMPTHVHAMAHLSGPACTTCCRAAAQLTHTHACCPLLSTRLPCHRC
jgi:hypothetical protein